MGGSAIDTVRDIILGSVRNSARGEWKVFVIDETTKALIDNTVSEDEILQQNVTNIEQIDHKRGMNATLDAVYFISPEPYVVDCLVNDLEVGRYRSFHINWTTYVPRELRDKIDRVPDVRQKIAQFRIIDLEFYPRESNLITFRDPFSFPILFHPACNQLVRKHMDELAGKIVSVCVALGEYPIVRYYRPRDAFHDTGVLCTHLARFVQESLDQYAKANHDFPPPSPRPRGALIITDRSMDVYSALIHEFTYQAMAHDLLPLKEGDKTFYSSVVNEGRPNQEKRDMELGEKDRIWVENRHLHMKDLLQKLVADFNKFRMENPQFADDNTSQPSTLNNIKDMLAGLPQFQEGKDLYSLHLAMAQECMNIFQNCKLPDIATAEQAMATGVDEDDKKPRNLADQLVRLLDDEAVTPVDRIRLVMQYVMHRDGVFAEDLERLLAHAQLPPQEGGMIHNLDVLGVRISRQLKETRNPPLPLFPRRPNTPSRQEELSITRFEPVLKKVIEEHLRGTLDQDLFPYTKPQVDAEDAIQNQMQSSQSSLRSAKPTWARTNPSAQKPRQRVIVFVAGGATYGEARACYEVSESMAKDVYMTSSHMLTPRFFLKQLSDLSVDRRRLDLPCDRAPRKAPAHAFERPAPPPQPQQQQQPSQPSRSHDLPTGGMAAMTMNSGSGSRPHTGSSGAAPRPAPMPQAPPAAAPAKLSKDKEHKEKKRFFKF